MILISYDISNDKKRSKFSKYISKFGHRVQYSVYEIENSNRILDNIIADINNKFMKEFDQTDSIYIYKMSNSCEVLKYGYAINEDSNMIIVK